MLFKMLNSWLIIKLIGIIIITLDLWWSISNNTEAFVSRKELSHCIVGLVLGFSLLLVSIKGEILEKIKYDKTL